MITVFAPEPGPQGPVQADRHHRGRDAKLDRKSGLAELLTPNNFFTCDEKPLCIRDVAARVVDDDDDEGDDDDDEHAVQDGVEKVWCWLFEISPIHPAYMCIVVRTIPLRTSYLR